MSKKRAISQRDEHVDGLNPAVETEDESDCDPEDAEIAASLMQHSCSKRSRLSDGAVAERRNGTAGNLGMRLRSSKTIGSSTDSLRTPITRRPALGTRDAQNTTLKGEGSLLGVGKVFSWALDKFWYPANTDDADGSLKSVGRDGFSFRETGQKEHLHSSMLSEENSTFYGDSLPLDSVLEEDDQPDVDVNVIPEGRVSDVFFTPVCSPDVGDVVVQRAAGPRRSIMSPRSSTGKVKGRVSINRTPQVREIANRLDQARDSSLIWEHRDLNETECKVFRVPGDTTPEVEKTNVFYFFPSSRNTKDQEDEEDEDDEDEEEEEEEETEEENLEEISEKTAEKTPEKTSAVLEAVSPRTREVVMALLDLQGSSSTPSASSSSLSSSSSSSSVGGRRPLGGFGKVSFTEVMAVAEAQQAASDRQEASFTQTVGMSGRKKNLGVAQKSSVLPILKKREKVVGTLGSAATSGGVVPTNVPVTSSTRHSLRHVVLPRLMPPFTPVVNVKSVVTFPRPAPVPLADCRPVAEMLVRKKTTHWLPPVFADDTEEEEEQAEQEEVEEEEEQEEEEEEQEEDRDDSEMMDAEKSGCDVWKPNAFSGLSSLEISGRSWRSEEETSSVGSSTTSVGSSTTSVGSSTTSTDVLTPSAGSSTTFVGSSTSFVGPSRMLLKAQTATLVEEIYARLKNVSEAKNKLRMQQLMEEKTDA